MANDKQDVCKVRVEERHYNDGRIQRKIGDGEWEEVPNPFGRRVVEVVDGDWGNIVWASSTELMSREEFKTRYPDKGAQADD